jgi:hypothetical protein
MTRAARVVQSGNHVLRGRYLWEAVLAVIFLALGYAFGGARYGHFALEGASTTGTVVAYETTHRKSRSRDRSRMTRTVYMPVVDFRANGRTIRFRNWSGDEIAPTSGATVRVLYDPDDPSLAMIDQPRNLLPWSPFAAVGAFMAVVAVRSWFVSRRERADR